ncbi:MAG: hypothetical protein AAF583_02735 [Pseudomonadota bacterium]
MAIEEDLTFRICETDDEKTPRRILARAENLIVAMAAYNAALDFYSRSAISLMQKARVIKHRPRPSKE